jgi:outer membrane receptor protein involved in Fe transport
MKMWSFVLALVLCAAVAVQAVVSTSQKTATTAATLLASTSQFQSESVLVINQGSVSVYLGGTSGVTSSTGLELKPSGGATIALKQNESLYGITATSSARVDVLESK